MNALRSIIHRSVILVPIFVLASTQGKGQVQRITYQWPNQPCAEMLNCVGGCSSCNLPTEQGPVVFGTNAALIGVEACPHPVAEGDNALWLSGWCATPELDHRILISGITQASVRIDSVIIVHHREADGPVRLAARFQDLGDGGGAVKDVPTPTSFVSTALTSCGIVEVPVGGQGAFQLQLQAYGGDGGAWVLDEVRIVTTLLEGELVTAVPELSNTTNASPANAFDLLGRSTTDHTTAGPHVQQGRIVVIQ